MLYIDFYAHSSVLYKRLLSYDKYLYFTPAKSIFFFCIALTRYTNFVIQNIGLPSLPHPFTSEKI